MKTETKEFLADYFKNLAIAAAAIFLLGMLLKLILLLVAGHP